MRNSKGDSRRLGQNPQRRKSIEERGDKSELGHSNSESEFDARQQVGPCPNYIERRRGSVVESRTDANKELISYSQKEVRVRTPRRGRSKSIVVPGTSSVPRSFPIGRLNNYNKNMKKHKGPLSMMSELESIEEADFSDKAESSRKESEIKDNQLNFFYDADKDKDEKSHESQSQGKLEVE